MNATRWISQGLRASNWPTRFAIVSCLTVFAFVIVLLYRRETFVTSNDAQVSRHSVILGSKVEGVVRRVWVESHQAVRRGQLLCELDDRDYRASLDKAVQDLESSRAELGLAQKNFERSRLLFDRKWISKQRYDQASAQLRSAEKQFAARQAALDAARLNFQYTRIVAPRDGVISVRSAEPGRWVAKGAALFAVVYPEDRWVTARMKETDLEDIRLGAPVEIQIDAIPRRSFQGRVESFSPSTEGVFAAIPPDGGAGNFNKFVQRVPVRIAFNALSVSDLERIRVGLSAEVTLRRHP